MEEKNVQEARAKRNGIVFYSNKIPIIGYETYRDEFEKIQSRIVPVEIDEYRLELENRIRNLLWTVSGDYQLDMKPDVSLFLRSKAIALYDGIKQGALARYYDKDMLGLYLVKKIFPNNYV